MKTLVVIGGLGNVGFHLLKTIENDLELNIICIARPNKKNLKKAKIFSKIKFVWADVLTQDISYILERADIIINLAAILPPFSEVDPEASNQINYLFVNDILKHTSSKTKIIFLSTSGAKFCNTVSKSKVFYKNYLTQKQNAEESIIKSNHLYTVIRPPFIWNNYFPVISASLFDIPLSNRMEFIHMDDVIHAIYQSIENNDNKVINLGGNSLCQVTYREYLAFCFAGCSPTNENLFSKNFYPTDWVDSNEYKQRISFEMMVKEVQKKHPLIYLYRRLFSSYIIKKWEKKSPYLTLSNETATD